MLRRRSTLVLVLVLVLGSALVLVACGASQQEPSARPVMPKPAVSGTPAPADELERLNAEIAKQGVTESIAGLTVEDPYRALEQDSAQTRAWMEAQSRRTEQALASARDPAAEARLAELLAIGQLGGASLAGKRAFFTLREGARERPALYMIDLRARATAGAPAFSPDKPLIDPRTYGERASIDYAVPSHDGRHVAFGISDSGDERASLRVLEVDSGKVLADTITRAKWSSIEWLADGKSFYYTRYPAPGEPNWNEREPESYFPRVFLHRLGSDPAGDPLVFGGREPVDFPSAAADESDRYVVFNNQRSWTASDVFLWDRGAQPAARQAAPSEAALQPIVRDRDNTTLGVVHRGALLLLTNIDAPRKRVVRVDPRRATDPGGWQTLIPEGAGSIEDLVVTRNFLVVHAIENVSSSLRIYDAGGKSAGEIVLPMAGSVSALSGARDADEVSFVWSSYFHPPTLFHYDLRARTLRELYRVESKFDAGAYELARASVRSKDGTPINVFYVKARTAATPPGETPVLLYGYGGFDVSLLPEFTRSALYWLERGGIYAVANLRGGGEFGEDWHRAGMLSSKHKVFEDFEAAIRWFSQSGLSNPRKIAITGGSNGGLLMGAMLTRAPDAFAAAASYVGLYDMLRYPLFPPAALWTSEYGDPQDPKMTGYLLSYSPYHRVERGVAYPAALIETADHDTRVFWGHSAKFAARLQAASAGAAPIHFYLERSVGHGRGTGLADLVRRQARQLAFLTQALQLTQAASTTAATPGAAPATN